jgi:hypothetical protein
MNDEVPPPLPPRLLGGIAAGLIVVALLALVLAGLDAGPKAIKKAALVVVPLMFVASFLSVAGWRSRLSRGTLGMSLSLLFGVAGFVVVLLWRAS